MILDILTNPHPNLRKKSRELTRDEILDTKFKDFLKDLEKTMLAKDGIGLAAPQVNNPIRVIAINMDNKPHIFINPKIIKKSWRKNIIEEGCLSVPGVYKKIKRPQAISLEFLDLEGKQHKIKTAGIGARVFQHEIDHLDGVLFIDKVK